jgi:hypothetical protein
MECGHHSLYVIHKFADNKTALGLSWNNNFHWFSIDILENNFVQGQGLTELKKL